MATCEGGRPRGRWGAIRGGVAAFAVLVGGLLAGGLLAGCGEGGSVAQGDAAGGNHVVWVNPDTGSRDAPVTLRANQMPYTGVITEGINYFRVVGLPTHTAHYLSVTGKRDDADLFVMNGRSFEDYLCGSTVGGPSDDLCTTLPQSGTELLVDVYGFPGTDTAFVLDVW